MGLLNEIVKGIAGKFLGVGGSQNPLVDIIIGLITNPRSGGIEGLVRNFKNKGMEDIMSSWISTGKNLPISGNQIQNALGMDQILQIAKQLGSSKEEVSGGLSRLLPQIIDKLTPNGSLPEGDALEEGLNKLKKGLLGI